MRRRRVAAAEGLPAERLSHGRVTRSAAQVVDAAGAVGRPYLVEDMLGTMLRRGLIDAGQREAGEMFRALFRAAAFDTLRSASLVRTSGGSNEPIGHRAEAARRRVGQALDALGGLGSPCGSCAWFVLGLEHTVAAWCRREGWGGKPLRHETATGLLIGALGVLAAHFRTAVPK